MNEPFLTLTSNLYNQNLHYCLHDRYSVLKQSVNTDNNKVLYNSVFVLFSFWLCFDLLCFCFLFVFVVLFCLLYFVFVSFV